MHSEVHECSSEKNNSQFSLRLGKVENSLRCSQLSLEHLLKDKYIKLFVKGIFLCLLVDCCIDTVVLLSV